jgi:CubicO group peptidase (beta-lactamase class C family)
MDLITAMTTPGQYDAGSKRGESVPGLHGGNYALGLQVGTWHNRRYIWHSGSSGGWRSVMLRYPDERLSVIVLSNAGPFYNRQCPSQWNLASAIAKIVRESTALAD